MLDLFLHSLHHDCTLVVPSPMFLRPNFLRIEDKPTEVLWQCGHEVVVGINEESPVGMVLIFESFFSTFAGMLSTSFVTRVESLPLERNGF